MIERYSRPEMSRIWGLENKFWAWLRVEIAVCEAWHNQGRIPADAMQEIREKAGFDLDRIQAIEEETKHDVIAFLTAVEEKVGPASRYIHLGCTSSDIVDTANALLLLEAGRLISADLDSFLQTLHRLSLEHKGRMCMGRTHGVHAEPMSYGLKMASFYAEFSRHKQRFDRALEGIRVGKISGAVGTYAHLSPEVERDALRLLGLEPDPVSTQIVQRDRHAEYFTSLALVAGGIERLGLELRHLQRTEVREAEEGFSKGQKGSSAMPHKKNPISAENLCGLARMVRSNSLSAMENMALWHERDISHSSVERVIMPDSTILVDYMLNRLDSILNRLRLIPENIDRNLESSYGLHFSQRLLIALLEKGLPRQKAYELVQEPALQAWEEGRSFRDLVLGKEEITSQLSRSELEELFDSQYYLRFEQEILDRVFPEKS
ncbi:MAG: adenylosuccinate lyase [Desulfohalobiaceae bacterium]|nr:adenylosuccinate lyase [Desulfohalobiaceae bacterium]